MKPRKGAASPSLPPLSASRPYNRLSAVLGRAYVPPEMVGSRYNDVRGRLWLRFQPGQTPPTAEEFEAAMVELYDLLRDAGMPNGVFVGPDAGWDLLVAKGWLDEAFELASTVGLHDE